MKLLRRFVVFIAVLAMSVLLSAGDADALDCDPFSGNGSRRGADNGAEGVCQSDVPTNGWGVSAIQLGATLIFESLTYVSGTGTSVLATCTGDGCAGVFVETLLVCKPSVGSCAFAYDYVDHNGDTVSVSAFVAASQVTTSNITASGGGFGAPPDETRPAVSTIDPSPQVYTFTSLDPISIEVVFDEDVTGFDLADITVTNATKADLVAGSATNYVFTLTPTGGDVTISVPENVAVDLSNNLNTASSTTTLTDNRDLTDPTVVFASQISSFSDLSTFSIAVTFSETVTGFAVGNIVAVNANVSNLGGQGRFMTVDVTPTGGDVTLDIGANVATDASGNGNEAATQIAFTDNRDLDAPTVAFSGQPTEYTDLTPFSVTITFSETVINFVVGDISAVNATLSNFSGSGTTYTVDVTPTGGGVTLDIAANVAEDGGGNGNEAAAQVAISDNTDNISPTVVISGTPSEFSDLTPFTVTVTFSESVTGFTIGDITVSNGTAADFSGSGTSYTALITPSGEGDLSLDVAAAVAEDGAGNTNTAASQVSATNGIVEDTEEEISSFVQTRASNIIQIQPDLGGFLTGTGDLSTRNYNLSLSGGNGLLNMGGSLINSVSTKNFAGKFDAWAQLRGVHSDAGTSSGDLVVGYLGAHKFIRKGLLIGAVLQVDYAAETNSAVSSSGSGHGYMIGPYVAGEFAGGKLQFEGQTKWGQSTNKISPIGTYQDAYTTQRWMVSGKIKGRKQMGQWTARPGFSLAYFTETQAEYTDSLSNVIAAQTMSLGDAKIGSEFNRDYVLKGGRVLGVNFGVSAVTNFAISNTAGSQGFALGAGDIRSRVDVGLNTQTKKGWDLSAKVFYDGIGVVNYQSYGGTLRVGIKF